ncbi:hypothetical protein [Argonema galeatum]|uniref:hypothetical protein n=1 Tax=Argonema galeatum TaxID=2942762 RepID=UPI0020124B15|nr:hypothetical protein [Argonema galeatum]MCL1465267.1 hypothetical protein [Argonema galeatum A003/A1]
MSNQTELEFQVYMAEYEALRNEHERLLQSRQQLLLAIFAAAAGLLGVIIANQSLVSNPNFSKLFLVLPLSFTLLTWWYIRNNYSCLLIELYLLTQLKLKIEDVIGNPLWWWKKFQWKAESSPEGRFIVFTQTLSKLGFIQGSAFVCLFAFCNQTKWQLTTWNFFDWLLILLNFIALLVTIRLVFISYQLVQKIRQEAR